MLVTVEAFTNVAAFRGLTATTLQHLVNETALVCHERREILYRQDEAAPGLYILVSGRIKLYRQSRERTQIFAILRPGDCFGAESLADNIANPYTAMTLTPAVCAHISIDRLRGLFKEYPDLQISILELVSERLQQFVALVHNLAFRDVTARLASVVMTLARVEGSTGEPYMSIPRLLTQQELASMVGTARDVVHRTFRNFERDHLVRLTSTHIFILDPEKLAEIAKQEAR